MARPARWAGRIIAGLVLATAMAFCVAAGLSRFTWNGLTPWDLRTIEAKRPGGDTFVVLYSGDGGWAPAVKGFSQRLSERGVPVLFVDSTRYFLLPYKAKSAAIVLAAMIDLYGERWGKPKVVLMGYSFGASALPLIAAELPPAERAKVKALVLASPGEKGELEMQTGTWFGRYGPHASRVEPALRRLDGAPVVCIYAKADPKAACPNFPAGLVNSHGLPGTHRFPGQYSAVADIAADTVSQKVATDLSAGRATENQ